MLQRIILSFFVLAVLTTTSCVSFKLAHLSDKDQESLCLQLHSEDSARRLVAASMLLATDAEKYVPLVGEQLAKEKEPFIKIAIIDCMGATGLPQAIPYLEPFLEDHSKTTIGISIGEERISKDTVLVSDEAAAAIAQIELSQKCNRKGDR